ncbi:hypothetical protein [Ancylobacter sp. IITR112]|uniref:hypothetical protein n=1 Tax=Ancylobacter sp. IITR112 TaxID=3138073 RepID=UPI00352B4434
MGSEVALYQFRVDGRAGPSPVRARWRDAADDAVRAGYAVWVLNKTAIKLDESSGGEIARVPPATRAALEEKGDT